jgi:hypothetical protein
MSDEKSETKDPMSPEKIRQHEPTAVKREMADEITSSGEAAGSPEEAREIARTKGIAKGTAGAAPTGDEYDQRAAGTNK